MINQKASQGGLVSFGLLDI